MERAMLKECPISCFADEIAINLDQQAEVLNKLNIKYIEFRSANGIAVADYTIEQAKEVKRYLDNSGIHVSAIGSPIGKINATDDFEEHMKKLCHIEQLADIFETPYIRMFSFYIPENTKAQDVRDEVMRRMECMINEAQKNNFVLLHENEKGIYGDNAIRCLDLMKSFYSNTFKATFDFANFIQCGQDTLEAYKMLKPYIEYVHIKDAKLEDGQVVLAGEGDGRLFEILKNLDDSGYRGFLSLEPHLANFAGLSKLEKSAAVREENDTKKAFCEAYHALEKLLEKKDEF